ncbi:MAG: hypothetical protein K0Q79_3147 [Flavipsychrobacter sp.]|nr:hypothetical protein [Flavipsychrobacter sp.]
MKGYTQPVWSPEVRAEDEARWMKDSLKLSAAKLKKAYSISLTYNRRMDSVNNLRHNDAGKDKQALTLKKDAAIKALLTKEQYKKYYRRAQKIRETENRRYEGKHQPY